MVLYVIFYASLLTSLAYYSISTILGMFKAQGASRRAVLITGCDTGFGRLAALKCLREGMTVFAGCLHQKSVKELEVSDAGGVCIPFVLDVTSDESVAAAKALVESRLSKHSGLFALINNAGSARVGFSDWIDMEEYKAIMDVDLFGMIRVTQTFLPMLKKSRGRIVNVSAFFGRFCQPGFGPYHTAKYAVNGYTDTLRREMSPFGVSVSLVQPGWHRTPTGSAGAIVTAFEHAWQKAGPEVRDDYGDEFITQFNRFIGTYLRSSWNSPEPERIADAYYHAITSAWPKKLYFVGPYAPAVAVLSSLPPAFQDYIWSKASGAFGHPKPVAAP